MRRKIFAVLLVLTTLLCGCSRNAIESQTDSTESTAAPIPDLIDKKEYDKIERKRRVWNERTKT